MVGDSRGGWLEESEAPAAALGTGVGYGRVTELLCALALGGRNRVPWKPGGETERRLGEAP